MSCLLRINSLIVKFLSLRNLSVDSSSFLLRSIYQGICFFDWKFFKTVDNIFSNSISDNLIRNYKLKLKNIIKSYTNSASISFLRILNNEIYNWLLRFSKTFHFGYICSELDFYLYKILWRWAKRRHSRRSNTWIYSKYWKFILGHWRFCLFDTKSGNLVFLRSHSFSNLKSYFLPTSLNTFDVFNQKKVNYIFFRKFLINLQGVYYLLWKKQYGLCFICGKSLAFSNLVNLKIVFLKSRRKSLYFNNVSMFVLLHQYCNCNF